MSLEIALIIFVPFAIVGLTLMCCSILVAQPIIRCRDQIDLANGDRLRDFVDFANLAQIYIKITGNKIRVFMVYSLSTSGAILFVFSIAMVIETLHLPK